MSQMFGGNVAAVPVLGTSAAFSPVFDSDVPLSGTSATFLTVFDTYIPLPGGAGVFFSAAPAPQISILRATAAQVTHSFAHLRQPTPRRKRLYTKGPGQLLLVGSSKNGSYLLSHLVGQYHRR